MEKLRKKDRLRRVVAVLLMVQLVMGLTCTAFGIDPPNISAHKSLPDFSIVCVNCGQMNQSGWTTCTNCHFNPSRYFDGNGGSTRGGGAGRNQYYTSSGGQNDSYGNERVPAYTAGTTTGVPLVDEGRQVINIPTYNSTTNNYYTSYNYTNITTNNINNTTTYTVSLDNSTKNYYEIVYAPTYTMVGYVEDDNVQYTHNYYFQLPDGRNSSLLSLADVNGIDLGYPVRNYELVMQDDRTMALYHFDGDLKDESAFNGSVTFSGNHKYVDRGSFGQGMVPGSSMFTFTLPASFNPNEDWTLEFTFYAKASTYPELLDEGDAYETKSGSGTFYYEDGAYTGTITGDWKNYRVFSISPFIRFGGQSALSTSYLGGSGPITDYKTGDICTVKVTDKKNTYFSNGSTYYYQKKGPHLSLTNETLTVGGDKNNRATTAIPSTWERFAIVRKDGMLNLYREGSKIQSWQAGTFDSNELRIGASIATFSSFYIDELRLTKGALYTGSAYTPSSMPFDTNKALVLPSNPTEKTLAVQSMLPVGKYRIGGVRPTFPAKGDVYIPVTASVAGTCQQYDGADWVPVGAAIYDGTTWKEVKGYTLNDTPEPLPEPEPEPDPDPPPDPGGDDSSSTPDPDPPGGGTSGGIPWDSLIDAIKGLFGGIVSVVTTIVNGLASILTIFTSLVGLLSGFSSGLTSVLGIFFGFLPTEILTVLSGGLTICIVLAVIKIMRG